MKQYELFESSNLFNFNIEFIGIVFIRDAQISPLE